MHEAFRLNLPRDLFSVILERCHEPQKRESAGGSLANGLRQTDRELPSSDTPGHSSITALRKYLSHPARLSIFHVCVCMCACLSSGKSNRVIYTGGGESGLQHHKFFLMPISAISQMIESCKAKHKCHCVIPGIPLCSAAGWMMRTRAPGRPCHPDKYLNKNLGHVILVHSLQRW